MLRELSGLLEELHAGLVAIEDRAGMQLTHVEMRLPLELRPILRDGGCRLLADVPRSLAVNHWNAAPSLLHVVWQLGEQS
ncbi:hypothetical protein VC218_01630 [Xanthomonas nasturtii]|uniref:hypothetical protein n=1 Tax=Xanthomonas nasturtii TaxID=1843581 RepID=UPI002B227492|nr:hypothetical protein [Xanthomonas nasturtii]MEA9577659.1 hypothetical protein [Xanthomonas nasturtii]